MRIATIPPLVPRYLETDFKEKEERAVALGLSLWTRRGCCLCFPALLSRRPSLETGPGASPIERCKGESSKHIRGRRFIPQIAGRLLAWDSFLPNPACRP